MGASEKPRGYNMGIVLGEDILRNIDGEYQRLSAHYYARPKSLRYYYLDDNHVAWSVKKPTLDDLEVDGFYDGQSVQDMIKALDNITPPLVGIDAAWGKDPVRAKKEEPMPQVSDRKPPRISVPESVKKIMASGELKKEMVEHPDHYNFGKYEVVDVLFDWQLPYPLSDVVKYVTRAGKKEPEKEREDLEKARFYLNYRIKELGGADWQPREKPTIIMNFDQGQMAPDEVRKAVQEAMGHRRAPE